MSTRTKRWMFLALVVIGAALIIYGRTYHRRSVLIEREVTVTPPAPATQTAVRPFPFGPPPSPQTAPAPVTYTAVLTLPLSEPDLIREATVGGLVRRPDGELKRTYADQPPEQCPT
jgi:hypothetical protein